MKLALPLVVATRLKDGFMPFAYENSGNVPVVKVIDLYTLAFVRFNVSFDLF